MGRVGPFDDRRDHGDRPLGGDDEIVVPRSVGDGIGQDSCYHT